MADGLGPSNGLRAPLAGLAALLCLLATVAAAQTVTIKSITPIPIYPSAINASGDVAGQLNFTSGDYHAAVYSHGIVTDLGTLGGCCSSAAAINNAGQVAGYSITSVLFAGDPTTQAFLFSGGVMRDLGDLGYPFSGAYGINASGEVVGLAAISDTQGAAFLYASGVMHNLGTLGGSSAQAYAINDAGDIVGYSLVPPPDFEHAFRYSNGAMQDLGGVGRTSMATAINASGQITGWMFDSSMSSTHAFRYANGVMTDLSPANNASSFGRGINASGQIVGTAGLPGDTNCSGQCAFLYTPANGIIDLNSLLPPNSGWVLTDASAINDAGQIVGTGTYQGQYNSHFLLKIGVVGDVNGDGKVDCADVSLVKASIGKKTGQPGFDPRADVNNDGVVDVRDLAIVTQALAPGTTCP